MGSHVWCTFVVATRVVDFWMFFGGYAFEYAKVGYSLPRREVETPLDIGPAFMVVYLLGKQLQRLWLASAAGSYVISLREHGIGRSGDHPRLVTNKSSHLFQIG
jgi:hypothetical protein